MKRLIYIFFLFALLSCDKEGGAVREARSMQFSVLTPEIVSTKGEVTVDGLISGTNPDQVYVYGVASDGVSSSPVFTFPGTAKLQYQSTTKTWKPLQINPETGKTDIDELWDNSGTLYYQFYGYAYSGNAALGTDLVINNEAAGRQFTIYQPETAEWSAAAKVDGSGTLDYLLSYLVDVPPAPSNNYPLVKLQLEHAMAKVEVDVQIASAMLGKVKNMKLQFSGIERAATMLCLQPKLDIESGTNSWIVNLKNLKATYTVTDIVCSEANLAEGEGVISPDMSFLAVPVTNSEMAGYGLMLSYYDIDAPLTGDPTYEYEFDLKDFSPKGWMSGHRVRYVLTIDDSIHLTSQIVDFEDVDYMEGVMLPDIAGTN